jgi:hypothetical protein
MELIHSEDREEFKKQLTWNSTLPQEKSSMTLHEIMMPGNSYIVDNKQFSFLKQQKTEILLKVVLNTHNTYPSLF